MTQQPTPWLLTLARPLAIRLDRSWRDEDLALAGLTQPQMILFSAQRLGFVERRTHWLTRRRQIRLSLQAITSNKLSAGLAKTGGFA